MGSAVFEENVFLRVVEVCMAVDVDARVGFGAGNVDGALVEAVVFQAGLQEDSLRFEGGEIQGCQECGENLC